MASSAVPSVTSSGLVTGDNPLKHSLLLLIVQIVVIICFSRFIKFVFQPLRQPRVIAEILAGILLGPSAIGRIPGFSEAIFPESSLDVLETAANLGLIFFLFLVGLELDLSVLSKSGGSAVGIATAGIGLPFLLGVPVSFEVFKAMGMKQSGKHFGLPFILFMGVSLSITAFPVLARILAERKILNTEIGQMAISAAALNDVVAWALLALAVAVTNSGSSPLVVVWVLLLGIAHLFIMFMFVRPLMLALAKRDPLPEVVIAVTFVLVLISSFATDAIGIHVIFGAFVMGLVVPKDKPISGVLIEKTEDYVTILLLPLYFTSSGLKTDLNSVNNLIAVGMLALVTAAAVAGKVLGTVLVTKLKGMPLRKCFAVGFLMSTKGLVELIVLNIGLSKGVINKEIFAIMVLMALITTFTTTPVIMWLYKPARDVPPYKRRKLEAKNADNDKLRILVCLRGMKNVPSMMKLIEMSKGRHSKLLQVNALHVIEFSERSSAIRMAAVAKAAEPMNLNEETEVEDDTPVNVDAVGMALRTFGQVNNVNIKIHLAVSSVSSMHEDICSAAANSRANLIILPYHKSPRPDGSLESAGTGFLHVNDRVMRNSPCSVAILVNRGLGGAAASPLVHILILFFGGPDDREALLIAKRMQEHGGVKLTIAQCIIKRPATLLRLCSDDLKKYLPQERVPILALEQSIDSLLRFKERSLRWFSATWRNNDCHVQTSEDSDNPPQITDAPNGSSQTQTVCICPPSFYQSTAAMDTKEQPKRPSNGQHHQPVSSTDKDAVQVAVNHLEQENEKKLDAKILGPLLAAAQLFKDATGSLESKGITVKVVEINDDPSQAVEELLADGDYGLILVGLHLDHPESAVQLAGNFRSGTSVDQGLGPVGNLLLSRDIDKSIRSSLLVVRQHRASFDESLGGMSDLHSVSDEQIADVGNRE